jgi:hypothetical protein
MSVNLTFIDGYWFKKDRSKLQHEISQLIVKAFLKWIDTHFVCWNSDRQYVHFTTGNAPRHSWKNFEVKDDHIQNTLYKHVFYSYLTYTWYTLNIYFTSGTVSIESKVH